MVVRTEKRPPKPRTTRYPIPLERGGSPPKKESSPEYFAKGGMSITSDMLGGRWSLVVVLPNKDERE